MQITISTGKTRKEKRWKIKTTTWDKLVTKLRTTQRTAETVSTYFSATKERKAEIKDVGGFVGGAVEGGRRIRGSVKKRSLITLDLDYALPDVWDDFTLLFGCAAVMYSTHSHTTDKPRYRLVIPLNREVGTEEYEAIARKVASDIGIDQFDDSSFQVERLMYFPSTSKDGEYVFHEQSGEALNADSILAEYRDWRDMSQWAVSSRVGNLIVKQMKKKGEPTEKPGAVGIFCQAYTIKEAIEAFLSDIYVPCGNDENRYTYAKGTSAGGLVIYEDKFAYSHHATDPAGEQMCNAFDLVRIHLFGDIDDDITEATPINKYPSFKEMESFTYKDEKVQHVRNEAIINGLRNDFEDIYEEEENNEDFDWLNNLQYDRNNNPKSCAENILLVLHNGKGLKDNIRWNDFTDKIEIINSLPWRKKNYEEDTEWRNTDDSGLRVYFDLNFHIKSKDLIIDCLVQAAKDNHYHPIKNYLKGLKWDGVKRAETLLIDYLGAEDTSLNRSITRKFLTAAISRVFRPGCKFDYVTVIKGMQGIGKSTLLAKLAGKWFNDSIITLQGKDAMEMLQGAWIIELGELQAIKRSEIENTKAFLSRQVDNYRPAYGRATESHPRQCVFFATTNEETFLKGSDGNRRFWTVSCVNTPTKDIFSFSEEDRDQIWAEAMGYYKNKEKLYLDKESETLMREIQAEYNEDVNDVRVGIIEEYLNKKLPPDWNSLSLDARTCYLADEDAIESRGTYLRDCVCLAEIMVECFHERIDEHNKFKAKDYANLMKKVKGWERKLTTMRFSFYGTQKYYKRITTEDI